MSDKKLDGVIITGYLVSIIIPGSEQNYETPGQVFMDESLADRYIESNPECTKTEIQVIFQPCFVMPKL